MTKRKKILRVLEGETVFPPPIWLMRQAGRYLPEYRTSRSKASGFLDLCYNPDLSAEVTMQPIERFDFDAAILFSDILVIPDALGRNVQFIENKGPQMDPIDVTGINKLRTSNALNHLTPIFKTIKTLTTSLPSKTTLLGFCGAPWTVATYMIAGHSTTDQAPARLFAYKHENEFLKLLDILADISADYLIAQIHAGADAVQIFDSWAGILGEHEFNRYAVAPVKRMIDRVRSQIPKAKIIAFAKGAGLMLKNYRQAVGSDGIGLDWSVPLGFAKELQKQGAVQGNLDPLLMVTGGKALDEGIDRIMNKLSDGPFIFNLGHGITPEADTDHVKRLIERIRTYQN